MRIPTRVVGSAGVGCWMRGATRRGRRWVRTAGGRERGLAAGHTESLLAGDLAEAGAESPSEHAEHQRIHVSS
jgi:hypothetical protein